MYSHTCRRHVHADSKYVFTYMQTVDELGCVCVCGGGGGGTVSCADLNATMKGECSDFVLYTKKAPSLWSRFSSCSACDSDFTPLCSHLISGWWWWWWCVCVRGGGMS